MLPDQSGVLFGGEFFPWFWLGWTPLPTHHREYVPLPDPWHGVHQTHGDVPNQIEHWQEVEGAQFLYTGSLVGLILLVSSVQHLAPGIIHVLSVRTIRWSGAIFDGAEVRCIPAKRVIVICK